MHKTLVVIFFALSITGAFAATKDDFSFKHHTFEVSLTQAADYHFVTNVNGTNPIWNAGGTDYKQINKSLSNPFIGANLGISYLYRPIKYLGISTGFNFIEFVNKMGKLTAPFDPPVGGPIITYAYLNGYMQTGYISVPVLIHGFYPAKKVILELATGPEFVMPFFDVVKYTATFNGQPRPQYNDNEKHLYSAQEVRKYSQLGWDLQFSVNIPVKNKFYMSVGPEMKFLSAHPLGADVDYSSKLHTIQYYAGIKVAFRFPKNFGHKKQNNI